MPQQITNQHIFDELRNLRLELKDDMSKIKIEVDVNTGFRNQLVGKMTAMFAVIGLIVNFAYDWVRDQIAS
mgnify:CR=1 FL=1|jgi:hypothetical protein